MRPGPGSADVSEVLSTLTRPGSPRFPSRAPGPRRAPLRRGLPRAGAAVGRGSGKGAPYPRRLVERGFGFPFVGPSPPPPPPGGGRSGISCAWGPRAAFRLMGTWPPSGRLEGRARLPGGVFLEDRAILGGVDPGAPKSCRQVRGEPGGTGLGGQAVPIPGAPLACTPRQIPAPCRGGGRRRGLQVWRLRGFASRPRNP